MDLEVEWSLEATEDLESIAEYIARDSEFYARAVLAEILAVSRRIREFPLIGRIVPEIGNDRIRERLLYSYRLGVSPKLTCHAASFPGNGTTFFDIATETRYVLDNSSQACSNRLL